MKDHLKSVAQSYDKAIELGKKGINLYKDLPDFITNHPDYQTYLILQNEVGQDSQRNEIKDFLNPDNNMKLVDLGCCLNLMFNGYDEWTSSYYGLDISKETIQLLDNYVKSKNLNIGGLHCGSIHETPYEDEYFDMATCIGVLEYFEKDFVITSLKEAHRILKPGGKLVLDIPNLENDVFEINKLIESHLGRPDKFDLSRDDFETIIEAYFEIINTEDVVGMIQYFLIKKD
ncbi:class I SAM-dependent methyltransferase [Acidaminobacter sp. JC074]|uniref:class I SAM-dependent methyltransferase n=1 Tax=Acidaminobacter sp. JC074 TaxID=2530199 RepID=UPI001F0DF1B0|nr:class I SAM-dependent methyltransferase [Acidaminobacter sp. JC074]MCH4886239.1 class I SAM-dependent methyltransferase [Acidaminobacter sp. JC074]